MEEAQSGKTPTKAVGCYGYLVFLRIVIIFKLIERVLIKLKFINELGFIPINIY